MSSDQLSPLERLMGTLVERLEQLTNTGERPTSAASESSAFQPLTVDVLRALDQRNPAILTPEQQMQYHQLLHLQEEGLAQVAAYRLQRSLWTSGSAEDPWIEALAPVPAVIPPHLPNDPTKQAGNTATSVPLLADGDLVTAQPDEAWPGPA
jgi:hypothetical protein